ncbi:hypothetical protein SLA2020_338380 [Shorea laevis]
MELSLTFHGHGLLAAFMFLLINLSLASSSSSSPPQGKSLPYMTSDAEEVAGKSFDYIVVGGGTAGCALAATLSERFTVLLVERVAQSFISKDGVMNRRGRVLGGSSAINFGFYSRASERFVKKVGLDKELVTEAYKWVESRIVFKPELTLWQTVAEFGLLEAGILPYNGFSFEHIEGTKVGATVFDECGIRHTSADLLEAGNPENITVLLNATVENVIFYNENRNKSRARGIRFIKSNGSPDQTHEAYLNQPESDGCSSWGDVILSAGALGSPQILLLSGIGPQQHLRNSSIPVVLDMEGVGQGMKDNPGIALLVDNKPQKRLPDTPQVVGIADDFKIIVEAGIIPVSLNATIMTVAAKVAFPESEGKLELNSRDPRENPSVQFNYLAKEKDLEECVKLSQLLERVARSQSIAMFVGTEHKNNLMSSEDELRKSCKKNGLRVVDGSTFLESPGTNPMATLLMLGRYQGIKILQEREDAGAFGIQQNP